MVSLSLASWMLPHDPEYEQVRETKNPKMEEITSCHVYLSVRQCSYSDKTVTDFQEDSPNVTSV